MIIAESETPFTLEELPPNFWEGEQSAPQEPAPHQEPERQDPSAPALEGTWGVLQTLFPGHIIHTETLSEDELETEGADVQKTPQDE